MRRIALGITATIGSLVLLFSYRTSTMGPLDADAADTGGADTGSAAGAPATTRGTTPTTKSGTGSASPGRSSTTTTRSPSSGGASATYDGSTVRTRFGNVQVRITVQNGRITDVTTLQVPDSTGKDQAINSRAVPALRQQVLSAQSVDIAGVSGATVTTDGYEESLQAALDAWHG
jgi:uncharacterized protein with FMN-binding domain